MRLVVIDEVHALAGTDRGAHLMSVLERVGRARLNHIQRLGLSAMVGNPERILHWMKGSSRREGVVVEPILEVNGHYKWISSMRRINANSSALVPTGS